MLWRRENTPWNPLNFSEVFSSLRFRVEWGWNGDRSDLQRRASRFTVIKKFNTQKLLPFWKSPKLRRMEKFFSPSPRFPALSFFPSLTWECKSSEISSRISFLKVTSPSYLPSPCSLSVSFLLKMYSTLLWMAIKMCFPFRLTVFSILFTYNSRNRIRWTFSSNPTHQFPPSPNFLPRSGCRCLGYIYGLRDC